MGLNAALSMAGRALEVFSTGIQVAGQNISNSATPGYVREELLLNPANVYRSGSVVLGTGVQVAGIRQRIDQFLEVRLHAANSDASSSNARNIIFKQLEGQINELGESDLSTSLNRFLGAVQTAATQPESAPARQLLLNHGQQLATDVASLRTRVDQLRSDQTVKVNSLVSEANELIQQIARLNPQITKLESAGLLQSDAGALRSQRYSALNRLSEIIPIKYTERSDGSVDVFSGTEYLILDDHTQQLQTETRVDRGVVVQDVILSNTKSIVTSNGGELAGVMQGRDEILGGFVDDLDQLASRLIGEMNRIHSSGEGLIGYEDVTGTTQVRNTGAPLNAAGLAFPPTHGSFQVKIRNQLTGVTETTTISIDLDGINPAADTSLQSLRNSLNANVQNLTATITADGSLSLTAADGYEIRFGNDTSGVLSALGINTFFSGSDSNSIAINPTLAQDQRLLALSRGGGDADGSNAGEMAQLLQRPLGSLQGQSLDGFYDLMLTAVAQGSSAEEAATSAYSSLRDSLQNQRSQTSGVSLDEETIKILEYQRSFQAAARIISTVDELFGVLLNI